MTGSDVRPLADDVLAARVELLIRLKAHDYRFVTPTQATHWLVVGRPEMASASNIRGVFGWNLPFEPDVLPDGLLALMRRAELVEEWGDHLRSMVRVSSLAGELFLHSAFPTISDDAVFFGPDTYRFVRLLEAELRGTAPVRTLVDIGSGSGAGGIVAVKLSKVERLILTDISPRAHDLARANAAAAGVEAEFTLGKGLSAVDGPLDLVVANPPFIAETDGPTYRAGGDLHGARLSLDWAREAVAKLSIGGRMILYTGSAIVGGRDELREALQAELSPDRFDVRYDEIDPDIFGSELGKKAYAGVERIAAVAAVITRRA